MKLLSTLAIATWIAFAVYLQAQTATPVPTPASSNIATAPVVTAPTLPIDSPIYVGYCGDGAYDVRKGVPGPITFRPCHIAAMKPLAAWGFRSITAVTYEGTYRDAATARDYWDPLFKAASDAGIELIPGMYLHWAVPSIYGLPPDGLLDTEHPAQPAAFLDPRLYADYLSRVRLMRDLYSIRHWYIDFEFTTWSYAKSDFFQKTPAHRAVLAEMVAGLLADIQAAGVIPIALDLDPNPGVPAYDQLAAEIRDRMRGRAFRPILLTAGGKSTDAAAVLQRDFGNALVFMATAASNTAWDSWTPAEWSGDFAKRAPDVQHRSAFFGRIFSFDPAQPYSPNVAEFGRLAAAAPQPLSASQPTSTTKELP